MDSDAPWCAARCPMVPDKENQERVVRDSGLDWVLVRPPTFLSLQLRGRARVIREGERGRAGLVVRSRLAQLLVDAAGSDDYVRQAIVAGH